MGNRLNFVQRSYQGHANYCVTFAIECLGNLQEIKSLIPKEMAYGLSYGHMIGDVTWPRKVKLVIPICLERNISKTAGDENFSNKR